MTMPTSSLKTYLGLPLLAAAATFVTLMLGTGIINSLPREMQGESVRTPWTLCVGLTLGISLALPWLASWPLLRPPRLRVYLLLYLTVAVALWWFVGFDDLFSKAYTRGL
jgi:hypothetical protein